MKLLFDENLSPRLVPRLADIYPDSLHVHDLGLGAADDRTLWAYAATHDLIIVSKDADFSQRSLTFGPPPKVVWIRRGNCPTREIELLLRRNQAMLEQFAADPYAGILEIL